MSTFDLSLAFVFFFKFHIDHFLQNFVLYVYLCMVVSVTILYFHILRNPWDNNRKSSDFEECGKSYIIGNTLCLSPLGIVADFGYTD